MYLKYITLFITLLLTLTGCEIFVEWPSSPHSKDVIVHQDSRPFINDARASCHWDNFHQDYIWEFDAWIDHSYGPREIAEVYVEVFDVWHGNAFMGSFPLFHDVNGHWDSYWYEWSETNLWCGDQYEFEFVAYDWHGHQDYLIVW